MYGLGCRDQVYGMAVGMGVWDGSRDQCMEWVYALAS